MKSLHKKIGAGALVVVLLGAPIAYAGRFSGIYIPGGMVHPNSPSSKQADLKVPFLLASQLYVASEEEIDRNDKNIVYGAHEIFGYRIQSFYPEGYNGERLQLVSGKKKRDFKDGNEFLRYLGNRDISSGIKIVKVGKQSYVLDFERNVKKGKMWWLYLDKWQYGAKVFFDGHGGKY